ncbi:MAG: AzlC family ABC transporter permease [Lachnoclostridium sp.]|nr:AzlC family ABC transporter permease [Lachnospira sp.]MCM1247912.1 AzlC family ABC transporter permease [Lachnoclostridium sp.]MCM1535715.1 AzlC family ABC transporter permease [Clostridium sp.]
MKTHEDTYSLRKAENGRIFREGMRDGVPIGIGYLAVSFSLGIAAKNAGLTPFQGFLASFLINASAGEYAGFTLIAAGGTYLEMVVMTLVVNARYLLMSCAMSQRVEPKLPWYHRLLMAYDITDELFAIAISRPGYLNPNYTYGAVLTAAPGWAVGTALGCIAGNLMPLRLVSAFSVALFGMFLAVIIPPARKNHVIAGLILFCFAASYAASHLPGIASVSDGTKTIVLTVAISAIAAVLFPKKEESEAMQ